MIININLSLFGLMLVMFLSRTAPAFGETIIPLLKDGVFYRTISFVISVMIENILLKSGSYRTLIGFIIQCDSHIKPLQKI